MQTTGSVEIEKPIEDVFRLTIDNVPQWSTIVVEDEILEETEDVVGTTFRTVTEEQGRRMEFSGMITAFDPPYRHSVHMTSAPFDIQVDYDFESIGSNTTRVTQTSDVKAKGVLKIIFFFLGGLMAKSSCAALQKELNGLKSYCERIE